MNPLEMLRAAVLDNEDESDAPKITAFGEAEVLHSMLAEFSKTHTFGRGMIVRQKSQCAAYNVKSDNGLAIVVEVFEPMIDDHEDESGSPYYRQPLDMIIGARSTAHGRTCFLCWHVDSRRFEPVNEKEL